MAGGAAPAGSLGFKGPYMPRNFVVPFCLVTSLFFLWGFAYGLLDVLNKHFQNVLGITKLQSTGLQVAYFGIGYLCFAPVAGEVLRRRGYKFAIIMGLCLYSTGAILFWPVSIKAAGGNPQAIFAGFVVLTGLTACGLATLEVTANSYITVMPPAGAAALRLQFSQAWNGVASFTGPLIASKYFFSGANATNLTNVGYIYIAVAGLGLIAIAGFVFIRLPEVSEVDLQAQMDALAETSGAGEDPQLAKSFWKQYRALAGALCQFMYVGAQVTIGTFFINLVTDDTDVSDSSASKLLSYALITFTVARFIFAALLSVLSPAFVLVVSSSVCAVLVALMGTLKGPGGVACMIISYAWMAPQYPVIFVLSTENLGRHTRRAASLLVMGVSGGAVLPPLQGAIATKFNTRVSMWVSFAPFIYIVLFSGYLWLQKGHKLLKSNEDAFVAAKLGSFASAEHALPARTMDEKEKDSFVESEHIQHRD